MSEIKAAGDPAGRTPPGRRGWPEAQAGHSECDRDAGTNSKKLEELQIASTNLKSSFEVEDSGGIRRTHVLLLASKLPARSRPVGPRLGAVGRDEQQ